MKRTMPLNIGFVCGLSLVLAAAASTAEAAIVPFTETFAGGAANWFDGPGTAVVDWNAAGGPGGSAYVSSSGGFLTANTDDPVLFFRAQDEFGSSGGAFVGNWIADGVNQFSAWVRHDAGVPLNFFTRFASPNNFPAANQVFFQPVPSGTWTQLVALLPNPTLIFEGPFTYQQVFSNIGHVQIGVTTPASLAGMDETFVFDLDDVSIVPEPMGLWLLGLVGLALLKRRSPADMTERDA